MKHLPIVAVFCAFLSPTVPAMAEDFGYQREDANNMQSCIETMRNINSDPEAIEQASAHMCVGTASNACQDAPPTGQTTIGMASCTQRETAWWDELLNNYYAMLQENFSEEEFAKLRDAQRAWIKFKDADCDMQYFYWREGTIRSLIGTSCHLEHTAARAIDLGEMLDWFNN